MLMPQFPRDADLIVTLFICVAAILSLRSGSGRNLESIPNYYRRSMGNIAWYIFVAGLAVATGYIVLKVSGCM
jgi:hypothetical protein